MVTSCVVRKLYSNLQKIKREDDDAFHLRLPRLQERLITDGHVCFPNGITCTNNRKKVLKAGKRDATLARVERIARLGN